MISNKMEGEKDPLSTFLFFNKKQKEDGLESLWQLIEQYYMTLYEWFKDKDLYHKIGYLITVNPKELISELVNESVIRTKNSFNNFLDEKISQTVNFEISELRYEKDHEKIQNVILLFNVETNRLTDGISEFYPFKQHKDNLWSLEHIHARNSENLGKTKREPWLEWLNNHKVIIVELLTNESSKIDKAKLQSALNDIEKYSNQQLTWVRFSNLFNMVNNLFTDDSESIDKESDGISNMALLSQPNNATLNNSVFEAKRRLIIDLDKNGNFIPVCTRRVFMKYYNDKTSNVFWTKEDRVSYEMAIRQLLVNYLPKTNTIQDDN